MSRNKLLGHALRGAILWFAGAAILSACNPDSTETAQQALSAVQDAAQTCQSVGAGVHQCLGALDACVKGASDDSAVASCKTDFAACLPADPPAHTGDHGPGMGGPHGHGGHPGGPAHAGGPGHPGGHGDMEGGCPGMGGGVPAACNPNAAVVDACKQNLEACLAAGGAAASCVATADECVQAAIQSRFKAMCEAHASQCDASGADAVVCDQLDRACNDGVALPSLDRPISVVRSKTTSP